MSKHDERLNPNSPIPLYHQLATILLAKLERGEIPLGSCIEPEWKLVERYGVSRTTVRRAIQELVQMGVLENKRGKGTIVKTNRVIRIYRVLVLPKTEHLAEHLAQNSKFYICYRTKRQSSKLRLALRNNRSKFTVQRRYVLGDLNFLHTSGDLG